MGRMSVKNVLNCPLCKEKELWFVFKNPHFIGEPDEKEFRFICSRIDAIARMLG